MTTTALFVWLGWSLAGLGALITGWALFWNCSRGRKRCPRCWYDMAGATAFPATCAECGRVVQRERGMYRTRRRRIIGAFAFGLVSLSAWLTPRAEAIQQRGWAAALPTEILVRWAPVRGVNSGWIIPDGALKPLASELNHRIAERRLPTRQYAILLSRCDREGGEPVAASLITRDKWHSDRARVLFNPPQWLPVCNQFDGVRIIGPHGDGALRPRHDHGGCFAPTYSVDVDLKLDPARQTHPVRIEVLRYDEPPGDEPVYFDAPPDEGRVVWQRTVALRTTVDLPIDEVIDQKAQPLLDAWFRETGIVEVVLGVRPWESRSGASRDEGILTISRVETLPPRTVDVVAFEIELRCDGDPIAIGRSVWTGWEEESFPAAGSPDTEHFRTAFPITLERVKGAGVAERSESAEWTVAIRAAPELAATQIGAKSCWVGEVETPVARIRLRPAFADGGVRRVWKNELHLATLGIDEAALDSVWRVWEPDALSAHPFR